MQTRNHLPKSPASAKTAILALAAVKAAVAAFERGEVNVHAALDAIRAAAASPAGCRINVRPARSRRRAA